MVTRWPPRTVWSAPRIASRPRAVALEQLLAPRRPTSATPSSRCSVEVYSSPRRRASSWARSITRLARGSRDSEPPWIRARRARMRGELAAERGEVHAEAPERLGGDPVVGLDERGEQVLGVEHGALHPLGELLGGDDGLLGLLGEAVELHGSGLVAVGSVGGRGRIRWWPGGRAGRRGRGTRVAASRASSSRAVGRTTRTFTYRSPAPSPFIRGMPWPVSRNVRPFWVPAGIVSRIRPLSVVTGHLGRRAAPRAA